MICRGSCCTYFFKFRPLWNDERWTRGREKEEAHYFANFLLPERKLEQSADRNHAFFSYFSSFLSFSLPDNKHTRTRGYYKQYNNIPFRYRTCNTIVATIIRCGSHHENVHFIHFFPFGSFFSLVLFVFVTNFDYSCAFIGWDAGVCIFFF